MTLVEFLPWAAGLSFIAVCGFVALGEPGRVRNAWMLPAALSAAFAAWSVATAGIEGPTSFWTEHTRNMWGNQIWFDLLLAAGTGWVMLAHQAKGLGMRLLPWLVLIVSSGSIGLLAMAARILYPKQTRTEPVR